MIVLSGALVLVALALLVIGLFQGTDGLAWIYASIGVSLVAGVCLALGVFTRRGETLPGEAAPLGTDGDERPEPAMAPAAAGRAPRADPVAASEDVPASEPQADAATGMSATDAPPPVEDVADAVSAEAERSGAYVFVVAGRPRYHVTGCRYLYGRTSEELPVSDAREEGFTPCGTCRPDETLVGGHSPVDGSADGRPEPGHQTGGVDMRRPDAPGQATRTATRPDVAAAPSGSGSTRVRSTAARAASAPLSSSRPGQVVVIPDRGKYHISECRYVRGIDGTVVLSRTAASRQGYAPCGVCKP